MLPHPLCGQEKYKEAVERGNNWQMEVFVNMEEGLRITSYNRLASHFPPWCGFQPVIDKLIRFILMSLR